MTTSIPIPASTKTFAPIVREADRFRPDIEGLRAVAVLVVVLSHARLAGFEGGYVGVDVFFVISGFLITGHLIREAETGRRRISLRDFYARRARRILPAAMLVVVVVMLACGPLIGQNASRPIYRDGTWTTLFAANFRFMNQGTDYFASQLAPSPLQHFWSLAVEEQFYLVWPLLIMAVAAIWTTKIRSALTLIMAVIIIATLTYCIATTSSDPTSAYFSPLTRAWELGVGAFLAATSNLYSRLRESTRTALLVAGLLLTLVPVVVYSSTTVFPGIAAAVPVIGAALIIAAGTGTQPRTVLARLLATPVLQFIGKMSYGWYLWHWPVLVLIERHSGEELPLATRLALMLAALGLAAASYYLIENPIRRSAPLKASSNNTLALAATALVFAVLLTSMQSGLNRAAKPVEVSAKVMPAWVNEDLTVKKVRAAVADSINTRTLSSDTKEHLSYVDSDGGAPAMGQANCLLDNVEVWNPTEPACVYGDVNAAKVVALFGDSHAAMWQPALDLLGRIHGFKVNVYTRGSCPAPTVHAWDQTAKKPFTVCDGYRQQIIATLNRTEPAVIVMASNHEPLVDSAGQPQLGGYEKEWKAGMLATLRALKPSGARLVVLGDLPRLAEAASDCLSRNVSHPYRCDTPLAVASPVQDHLDAESSATRKAKGHYYDVTRLLCTSKTCPAAIGPIVAYQDRFHLSGRYVTYLSPLVLKWIGGPDLEKK